MMKTKILALLLIASSAWAQLASTDIEITFPHGGCEFKGSLSLPAGEGPFPTILIIPGSGQNTRDGMIPFVGENAECMTPNLVGDTAYTYRDLAYNLTKKGFAVFRYDELMISCPTFTGPFTYQTLWLPAQSALNEIKLHPEVDAEKLILLGHSEGASIINYIASKRSDIKALISLAGARTPMDSILLRQLAEIGQRCSPQDSMKTKFGIFQIESYFKMIRSKSYTEQTPPFGGASAEVWAQYLAVGDSVSAYYHKLEIPCLFIGLEKDFNVPPSELARFKADLSSQDNIKFISIEGLTHYLCTEDSAQQSPLVANNISLWLKAQKL
jgi:alpha-beta hydrolase superfamily lysophospholipase